MTWNGKDWRNRQALYPFRRARITVQSRIDARALKSYTSKKTAKTLNHRLSVARCPRRARVHDRDVKDIDKFIGRARSW